MQKLIDKQEKYKWHDLIKNPDDLPPINPENTYENDVYLYIDVLISDSFGNLKFFVGSNELLYIEDTFYKEKLKEIYNEKDY